MPLLTYERKSALRVGLFAFAVNLYTTFVMQQLWNWFVASTLHFPEVGYWQMFGIVMLLSLARPESNAIQEDRWKRSVLMMYSSIPEAKKTEVDDAIKELNENVIWGLGAEVFGTLVGNTASLGIGWAVRNFLL